MSSEAAYLLAVYVLAHRREPPIRTSVVADRLGKSPASVTEMFQRLDRDGLLRYERYEGATLTETGRERAARLHETYVTVSWFFRSVLELDAYEAEAMELAGLLGPAVAERLAATLPYDAESPNQRSTSSRTASEDESSERR